MIGRLALSRQGHDKGLVYVILGGDERKLTLTDGRLHPINKPKVKNRKHISLTATSVPQHMMNSDEAIRRFIEGYRTNKEN